MPTRSKILIIGNGFDLYHELPTKYLQFIQVLKNIDSLKNQIESTVKFDKLFLGVDRLEQIKNKYNTEKIHVNANKVFEIKEKLKKNVWYQSFKNKLEFENWIDIENEIEETLKILNKNFIKINELLNSDLNVQNITVNFKGIGRVNEIKLNKHDLKYFKTFKIIDTSNESLRISNEFFYIVDKELIKFKTNEFFESLYSELKEFIEIFNFYLTDIINLLYEKINSEYLNNLEILKNEISFSYTFNYTQTLEKLYKIESSKINYLHGKNNVENNNIVLGIEDNEELKNNKIFMFSKYYQKLF